MRTAWRLQVRLLLLLSFVISACGPAVLEPGATPIAVGEIPNTAAPLPTQPRDSTPPPAQVISIWLDWEPAELKGLFRVIERYQRDNPGVEFALTYHPRDELLSAFKGRADSAGGPSILFGPSSWGPGLRETGEILNLSPLLDPGMESDVLPLAWSQTAQGTQLYGLPIELHGWVLYRNRSLAPEPVADLDEWLEVRQQLAKEGIESIILDLGMEVSLPMVAACGAELFEERGKLSIFEKAGTCWLELFQQMAGLGKVVFDSDEDLEIFERGGAAWLIASTEQRPQLIEAVGLANLKIDPWPLYEAGGFPLRGYAWTENAYLVAGSTESDLEASWLFMRFLFGTEGQEILSDPAEAAHIPTTSAIEPPDALMLQASSMLRVAVPLPLLDDLTLVAGPLQAAIQSVVFQGADPGFALRLAEERIELLQSQAATP